MESFLAGMYPFCVPVSPTTTHYRCAPDKRNPVRRTDIGIPQKEFLQIVLNAESDQRVPYVSALSSGDTVTYP